MNVVLGRDDLQWGNNNTGSLTIGDHLDYYEFIKFSTFHKNFKYTYLIAGFDSPSWTSRNQNSTVNDDDISIDENGHVTDIGPSDNLKNVCSSQRGV